MKKLLLLGIAVIMMTACQKDDDVTTPRETFTVTATLPQDADTRLGYEEVGRNMKVTWEVGDQITDLDGITISSPLVRENITNGGTSATFTFSVPEPANGTTLYYKSAYQVNQHQDLGYSTAGLSEYHKMSGEYNNGNISFAHDISIMRIVLSGLLEGKNPTSLSLHSDEGYYYWLILDNRNDITVGKTFIAYVVVDPAVLNGAPKIRFRLTYETDETQECTINFPNGGINITAGKLLHCALNMNKEVEDAEKQRFLAWYTADKTAGFDLGTNIDLTDEPLVSRDLPAGITFNGNGHTIKGLQASRPIGNGGLFAENSGTIKNVIVQGATVTGAYGGAIAGSNKATGYIIGCQSINCTIQPLTSAGGIVGENKGIVVACYESGSTISPTGDLPSGGIVGINQGTNSIIACYAFPGTIDVITFKGAILGMNVYTDITPGCYWQHGTLTKGVGTGYNDTTQSDYADCWQAMNTALIGTAAQGVVSWGENGLVY